MINVKAEIFPCIFSCPATIKLTYHHHIHMPFIPIYIGTCSFFLYFTCITPNSQHHQQEQHQHELQGPPSAAAIGYNKPSPPAIPRLYRQRWWLMLEAALYCWRLYLMLIEAVLCYAVRCCFVSSRDQASCLAAA